MINGFTRNEIMKLIWNKPSLAQIKITNKCNQRCCFCYEGCSPENNSPDLSIDEWKYIFEKLRNGGIYNLNFSGGEIFLYKGIKELFKYARELGFNITANTNGTIEFSECIPYIDEIVFSIHGIGDIHNRIVNANTFNTIEKNVSIANDMRATISINMTIVKSNLNHILDTFNYFNSKYKINKFAPTIAVETDYGTLFSEDQKIEFSGQIFEEYLSVMKLLPQNKLKLKHGLQAIYDNDTSQYLSHSSILSSYCIAGKSKILIQSNGDVYPCSFFETEKYYCGNILHDNLSKIWGQGKGFIPFREIILNNNYPEECMNCIKLTRCSSRCRAWTLNYISGKREELFNEKDCRCKLANAFIGIRNNN